MDFEKDKKENQDNNGKRDPKFANISYIHTKRQEIEKDYEHRSKKLGKIYYWPKMNLDRDNEFHKEILLEESEEFLTIQDRFWGGLSAYMDGELSAEKQREVTNHLMECPSCREKFNQLNDLNRVVKQEYKLPDDFVIDEDFASKVINSPDEEFYEMPSNQDEFWTKLERRIDEEEPLRSKKPISYKKLASVAAVVAMISLASIASLKHKTNYNYVPPQNDNVNWSQLDLTKAQVQKLQSIDKLWLNFKKEKESLIAESREKLDRELAKSDPNLTLIDKYQRDILDNEILLKRENANIFLEKRFVLNEEQTFDLFQQLSSRE